MNYFIQKVLKIKFDKLFNLYSYTYKLMPYSLLYFIILISFVVFINIQTEILTFLYLDKLNLTCKY